MNQKKQLVSNIILISISKISSFLSLFLLLPVMTAKMSTGDYGLVDLVVSYSGLIVPIALLSLHEGVFRHLIDARGNEQMKRAIISTTLNLVAPLIVGISALYLAVSFFVHFELAVVVLLYILTSVGEQLFTNISRGLGKTKEYTIGSLISNVGSILLIVTSLLVFDAGVVGVFIAYSIAKLISIIYCVIATNTKSYLTFKDKDKKIQKDMLRYSLPIIPNAISWWVFSVSDRTVISLVIGAAANGIYAVSNKFASMLAAFQSVIWMAWQESASVNIGKDPKERDEFFSDVFRLNIAGMGGVAILLLAGTAIGFPLLISPEFDEAYLYAPVLILGGLFNIVVSFYSGIYAAKKLTKQVMQTSILAAVIDLVINLALIWFIGLWAAAISTAVAYGAMAIYRYFDMKKYVNIKYDKKLIVAVFALFVFCSILYYFNIGWLNIINLAIAAVATLTLNKNLIKSGLTLAKSKINK